MSYPEYKEIVQYALDRLGLKKSFEIMLYDTDTFIEMTTLTLTLNSPKSKELIARYNVEEYGNIEGSPIAQNDCYLLIDRTPEKEREENKKWLEQLVKERKIPRKFLNLKEKIEKYDFIILINRNIIDTYVRKESKFTAIVHEAIHLAQDENLVPEGLTLEDLDKKAQEIVRDFVVGKGESFIGDMLLERKS